MYAKFQLIYSKIGFKPYIAAPTFIPVNPFSVIGVSQTLSFPN